MPLYVPLISTIISFPCPHSLRLIFLILFLKYISSGFQYQLHYDYYEIVPVECLLNKYLFSLIIVIIIRRSNDEDKLPSRFIFSYNFGKKFNLMLEIVFHIALRETSVEILLIMFE